MSDALLQFHRAVYARLSTDAGLLAYRHGSMATPGVRTFAERVPSGTKFPYNIMESMSGTAAQVFGGQGSAMRSQVGTWDNYDGIDRIGEIAVLIGEALAQPLEVAGWGTVQAEIDDQFTAPQQGFRRLVHIIGAELVR